MNDTPPELEPQAKIIMEGIVGPLEENDERYVFSDSLEAIRQDPFRYISYGLTDNSRNKREGNVLTGMREFDMNVAPDSLLRVATQITETVAALEKIGFTIRNTGMYDVSYQVKADKVVTIENLQSELRALADLLELTKK